jgi:hypothetical protein
MDTAAPLTSRSSEQPFDATATEDSPAPEVGEVNEKYEQWRSLRRPYEIQWFINAAYIRGQSNVKWDPLKRKLEPKRTPSYREHKRINRILPKIQARLAKFLKARPIPSVVPASTDREDTLNAQATEKRLNYIWRKRHLETRYEDRLLWAMTCGKSFWWLHWDDTALAPIKVPVEELQDPSAPPIVNAPIGDVEVEVGTSFEVLVRDPGKMRLADQPELMRVRLLPTSELEARYPQLKGKIQSDDASSDIFTYQRQIADIGAANASAFAFSSSEKQKTKGKQSLVKELYTAPCSDHPNGRMVIVVGGQLARKADTLPYGFSNSDNPYPCVEFADMITSGQFWPTTMVEQLIGLQEEYNQIRGRLSEHQKLQTHPKLLIPNQAGIPDSAYTSEPGEKIRFNFIPGMPQPTFLTPPPIASDLWRALDMIRSEFDEVSNLYPASQGSAAGATSGFQTNLLQEAADSIHAPNIRRNELSIEEAAYKIRHLMAMGYDIPRLVSIVGKDKQPEVFEFSSDNIDEHAEIIVQTGSALPTLKSARIQAILELFNAGLFGNGQDAEVRRRVLSMIELGSTDTEMNFLQRDEQQARLENLDLTKGNQLPPPMPWENHDVHYAMHTDLLKSSEIKSLPPEVREELIRHVIKHTSFVNPGNAMHLAGMFGMQDLLLEIQQLAQQQQQPPPGAAPDGSQPQPPQAPERAAQPPQGAVAPPQ